MNVLDISRLPPTWKLVRLSEVVKFQGGSQPPKSVFAYEEIEGYVRLVQIRDFRTDKFKTYIPINQSKRFFEKDDIMIGRYGPPLFQILRGLSGSFNVALMKAIPKENLDRDYLFYLLQAPKLQNYVITNSQRTAGQTGVNLDLLNGIQIPLPPLPEQKRIAEILDKADALQKKRRLTFQKLDTLLQSVFLEMFGDPVKNPKGWEKLQLKEIGKVTTGSTPSSELSNMFGGAVPFVTPSDLERVDKQVGRTLTDEGGKHSRIVRKGSTLVCCIGATIGKVGKAFAPSSFNQQINAIEWNEDINDDFGFHLLKFYKPIIAALGASTTLPILKKSSFEKIKFPTPPIELQNKFSVIVKKIELLKSKEIVAIEKAKTLFQSLQQRAFKGELFSDELPSAELQEEKVWRQTSLS